MTERPTAPQPRQHPARTLAPEAPGLKRLGRCTWRVTGETGGQAIFIERTSDLVVLDSTESMEKASEVLGNIRVVTDKPVGVLIYASGELASIGGAAGILGSSEADIIAAATFTPEHIKSGTNAPGLHNVRNLRSKRLRGSSVGKREDPNLGRGFLRPTQRIDQTPLDLSEPDLPIQIHATPALRGDQLSVWLPQERLLVGSSLFPNNASWSEHMLKGPLPVFSTWQQTLEDVQALAPECIATVRDTDLTGADRVAEYLRNHLTTLQSVDAQIAEGLAEGVTPAELLHLVRLPAELSDVEDIAPLAQTLGWIAQAKCQQATGWFDGNPTSLARLSPRDEARRIIRLAGGADAILQEAETTDTPQWGLELCDRLILAGERLDDARSLKSACLHILAEAENDPIRENYYLACAREIEL